MRLAASLALFALQVLRCDAADMTGKLGLYYAKPSEGSCRLLNIDGNPSVRYASVPGAKMSTCGRCVQVTCQDTSCTAGSSVIAYVTDAMDATQASGPLKLSPDAAKVLTSSNLNSPISISWKYVICPDTIISGTIKACFMDGASQDYLPIQFFNSFRQIENATFGTVPAKASADGFYFTSGKVSDDVGFYSNVPVTLVSGESTIKGTMSFKNPGTATTGNCADTGIQFPKPSDDAAGAVDPLNPSGGKGKSDSSSSALLPAILGGVGGLVLIAAIVFFIRRRRAAMEDKEDDDDGFHVQSTTHAHPHNQSGSGGAYDPRAPSFKEVVKPTPAQNISPAILGGSTPTLRDNSTPSTSYSRVDSDHIDKASGLDAMIAAEPPKPLVIPERQPAAKPKVLVKSLEEIRASQNRGTSYSDMFNDANRALYSRGSSVLANQQSREDRKSYDIDEERDDDDDELDAQAAAILAAAQAQPGLYDEAAVRADNGTLTSPESYVRATALPRGSQSQRDRVPTFEAPRSSIGGNTGHASQSNLLGYQRKKRQVSQHQF
ncbi:Aste57867_11402 [Aphanomyces stellatus]|uniref:Aste57867_11402 protein n=1 Tax=Aphanomyces stellatus TaxID=120398 RepID=A0A485KSW6_9STRA|nr:hypothetical protein As57867_011360 [Aphanomyces stellatus]VFT88263.1 Aste57867_11402 [Aphanomyces stellatus]